MRIGRLFRRILTPAPDTIPAPWIESDISYRARILERMRAVHLRAQIAMGGDLDRIGERLNIPRGVRK